MKSTFPIHTNVNYLFMHYSLNVLACISNTASSAKSIAADIKNACCDETFVHM